MLSRCSPGKIINLDLRAAAGSEGSRPEIQTAIVQITAFPLLVGVPLTSPWALERATGRQKTEGCPCPPGTTPPQLKSSTIPSTTANALSNWSETQRANNSSDDGLLLFET